MKRMNKDEFITLYNQIERNVMDKLFKDIEEEIKDDKEKLIFIQHMGAHVILISKLLLDELLENLFNE